MPTGFGAYAGPANGYGLDRKTIARLRASPMGTRKNVEKTRRTSVTTLEINAGK
jgi:hypothetical protein